MSTMLLLGAIACIPLRARNYEFGSATFTPRPEFQGVVRLLANNNSPEKRGSPFTLAVAVHVPGPASDSVAIASIEIRHHDQSAAADIERLRLTPASGDATKWILAYPGIPLEYRPVRITGTVVVWRSGASERIQFDLVLEPNPKVEWILWPWSFLRV